jgi:hypothetical protein
MDDTITHNHHLLLVRRTLEGLGAPERPASPLVHRRGYDRPPGSRRLLRRERGALPPVPARVRLRARHEISKSRFNRRLHAIEPELWRGLFSMLAGVFKRRNTQGTYAVDSLPVAACDNIPIRRCRLYPPEEHGGAFRGYIASKRRYFYGLRVHLVVTEAGEPVEFALAAGSEADVSVFKDLELDLPEGSIICADKAYTDYDYEDLLKEVGLHLKAQRKKNSKRLLPPWEEFLGKPVRQYIETAFGGLSGLFSKKIHAVTPQGFELKIVWFLLVVSIQCL